MFRLNSDGLIRREVVGESVTVAGVRWNQDHRAKRNDMAVWPMLSTMSISRCAIRGRGYGTNKTPVECIEKEWSEKRLGGSVSITSIGRRSVKTCGSWVEGVRLCQRSAWFALP